MAKIKIDYDDSQLRKNLSVFGSTINRRVAVVMDYNAGYTTGWLKRNAPWHDNTGAARTGLVAIPFTLGNKHEILMSYSVYYGIWLEIAHSGHWAIITPAMRIVGAKIMQDMQQLLNNSLGGKK